MDWNLYHCTLNLCWTNYVRIWTELRKFKFMMKKRFTWRTKFQKQSKLYSEQIWYSFRIFYVWCRQKCIISAMDTSNCCWEIHHIHFCSQLNTLNNNIHWTSVRCSMSDQYRKLLFSLYIEMLRMKFHHTIILICWTKPPKWCVSFTKKKIIFINSNPVSYHYRTMKIKNVLDHELLWR